MYSFIGGTACDILLREMGILLRSTKDLDIVLLIGSVDELFCRVFGSLLRMVSIPIEIKVLERPSSTDSQNRGAPVVQ